MGIQECEVSGGGSLVIMRIMRPGYKCPLLQGCSRQGGYKEEMSKEVLLLAIG